MTREEVIRLAKLAGNSAIDPLGLGGIDINWLECFAELVAASEREACAVVCDEIKTKSRSSLFRSGAEICSGEIRARGDSK